MKVFGISLMTIALLVLAFYVGRKTTLLNFLPVVG